MLKRLIRKYPSLDRNSFAAIKYHLFMCKAHRRHADFIKLDLAWKETVESQRIDSVGTDEETRIKFDRMYPLERPSVLTVFQAQFLTRWNPELTIPADALCEEARAYIAYLQATQATEAANHSTQEQAVQKENYADPRSAGTKSLQQMEALVARFAQAEGSKPNKGGFGRKAPKEPVVEELTEEHPLVVLPVGHTEQSIGAVSSPFATQADTPNTGDFQTVEDEPVFRPNGQSESGSGKELADQTERNTVGPVLSYAEQGLESKSCGALAREASKCVQQNVTEQSWVEGNQLVLGPLGTSSRPSALNEAELGPGEYVPEHERSTRERTPNLEFENVKEACIKLVKAGQAFKARVGYNMNTSQKQIQTLEQLETFFGSQPVKHFGYTLELMLGESSSFAQGLVCIDFDNLLAWNKVLSHITLDEHGNRKAVDELPIINPSLNGGHLIYRHPDTSRGKKRIKAMLNLGTRGDCLLDRVVLAGYNKAIVAPFPNLEKLPTLPVWLERYPRQKAPDLLHAPFTEGCRNESLFKWINTLSLDAAARTEVALVVNSLFCNPPLPIDEVVGIATRASASEGGSDSDAEHAKRNEMVAANALADQELFMRDMKGKYKYHYASKIWHKWTGTHYTPMEDRLMEGELRKQVLAKAGLLKADLQKKDPTQVATNLLGMLQYSLRVTDEDKDMPSGMSFKNGYLIFEGRQFVPHTPSRFITQAPSMEYDPDAKLGPETIRFLLTVSARKLSVILYLRICGHHALVPCRDAQVGFWICGVPGTGKSIWTRLLEFMSGPWGGAFQMDEMKKGFTRATNVGKICLLMNDVGKINPTDLEWLKKMLGRDSFPIEEKYKPGNPTVRFDGTMVFTSNYSAVESMGEDDAVRDRIVTIPFAPFIGAKDSKLYYRLQSESSGLINWLLSLPDECTEHFVRAGHLYRKQDVEGDASLLYLTEKMVQDDHGSVQISALYMEIQNFAKARGLADPLPFGRWKQPFINNCTRIFSFTPLEQRQRSEENTRVVVFVGLRFASSEKDKTLPLPRRGADPRYEAWADFPTKDFDTTREVEYQSEEAARPLSELQIVAAAHESATQVSMLASLDAASILENYKLDPLSPKAPRKLLPNIAKSWSHSSSLSLHALSKVRVDPDVVTKSWPEEIGGFENQGASKSKLSVKNVRSYEELIELGNTVVYKHLTQNEAEKLFTDLRSQFLITITIPLEKRMLPTPVRFKPGRPHPVALLLRERCEILNNVGKIANQFECSLGPVGPLWGQIISEAKRLYPDAINIQQVKKGGGRILPYRYCFAPKEYFRFNSWPPHTARDSHKHVRHLMMRSIGRISTLPIYEVDLSACHLRVLSLCVGEKNAPFLTRAISEEDLWTELADELKGEHPDLKDLPTKILRKAIKVKCLALINGGHLGTPAHVTNQFKDKIDDNGELCMRYADRVIKILESHPTCLEFRKSALTVCEKGSVYTMCSDKQFKPTLTKGRTEGVFTSHQLKEVETLNSKVYSSVESVTLTYLAQFGSTWRKPLVMIMGIHDCAVFVAQDVLSPDEQTQFATEFVSFTSQQLLVEMPVGLKTYEADEN